MDKNTLVESFSRACFDMAMFMDVYLPESMRNDADVAAPLFEETAIDDIENWWKIDRHLKDYIHQNTKLYARNYPRFNDNFQAGVAELQQNEALIDQFRVFVNQAERNMNYLKYLPHRADYATSLKSTEGFKALQDVCRKMPNVEVHPLVSVDTDKGDLRSAFCLGVQILSTTGRSLVSKIDRAHNRGTFRAVERRLFA